MKWTYTDLIGKCGCGFVAIFDIDHTVDLVGIEIGHVEYLRRSKDRCILHSVQRTLLKFVTDNLPRAQERALKAQERIIEATSRGEVHNHGGDS